MIRGNYSLASEVRKNESKQRQRIQQRQKHQHKLEKLSSGDPLKIYFQIQKLESLDKSQLDHVQKKKLHDLRQDWAFIIKNKLFKDKIDKFLKNQEEVRQAKLKAESKLWGHQSVYFNAELNPLGKVPDASKVTIENCSSFRNLKKTSEFSLLCAPDPLIAQLGIQAPEGEPPRFYKSVQNKVLPHSVSETKHESSIIPQKRRKEEYLDSRLDTDSEHEVLSDD